MKLDVFTKEFHNIFQQFGNTGISDSERPIVFDVKKHFLQFFLTGESFYFSMNHYVLDFDFVSNEVTDILGYHPSEFTAAKVIEITHPEDRPYFLSFGYALKEFNETLSMKKIMKYKLRYDIRLMKKDGAYIRLLYQAMVVANEGETIVRTMGTYTDITYLKQEGTPILSFIGMDGEPSYINVTISKRFLETADNLTNREKQVLVLLAEGKASKEIASELNISKQTVDKHRKNMLFKKGLHNTGELVSKAIKSGWI